MYRLIKSVHMRVAIVDDALKDRQILESFLKQYEKENDVSFEIETYSSANGFLESDLNIDIAFFDVEMPGLDGLKMAEYFREKNEEAIILFITNIAQYAIAGYKVQAFDYVIKPIVYPDFALKMRKVMKLINSKQTDYITLNTRKGIIRLAIEDLVYVEVSGHDVFYHFVDREIRLVGSMNKVMEKVEQYNFVRVSKFFLVNVSCIRMIKGNSVIMNSGADIPLGRIYRKTLLDKLSKNI